MQLEVTQAVCSCQSKVMNLWWRLSMWQYITIKHEKLMYSVPANFWYCHVKKCCWCQPISDSQSMLLHQPSSLPILGGLSFYIYRAGPLVIGHPFAADHDPTDFSSISKGRLPLAADSSLSMSLRKRRHLANAPGSCWYVKSLYGQFVTNCILLRKSKKENAWYYEEEI